MFAEVKSMLPVSGDGYDSDIIIQIKAAVADLTKTEQIVLNGIVNISRIWHDRVFIRQRAVVDDLPVSRFFAFRSDYRIMPYP